MRTGTRFGNLSKYTYGKTKWGGVRHSLVQETLDEWCCQCCGKDQAKGMPEYMHELLEKEFFRVCSMCFRDLNDGKSWTDTKLAHQGRQ